MEDRMITSYFVDDGALLNEVNLERFPRLHCFPVPTPKLYLYKEILWVQWWSRPVIFPETNGQRAYNTWQEMYPLDIAAIFAMNLAGCSVVFLGELGEFPGGTLQGNSDQILVGILLPNGDTIAIPIHVCTCQPRPLFYIHPDFEESLLPK
jgi:hypothetical protein